MAGRTETAGTETDDSQAATVPVAASAVWARQFGRWWPWLVGTLVVVALLGLQSQLYAGQERTVSTVFMYVALAQGWNVIGGFTGYACFGQVVFFGLGGYATAVLMAKSSLSFWLALPISGLLAGLFAVLIGMPLLRLKGHYFAIATLGVAEGMREVVTNTTSLTGGGAGISVPIVGPGAPTPYPGNDGFYLIFLALAVAAVAVVALLSRSRFGYALRAVNQDEDAAGAAGINTPRAKVAAFGLSGLMTGLVGAAYAFQQVTIFPQRLFDIEITVLIIVMVVIGGSGTVLGPVVGAVGLQYLSEYLRQHYTDFHIFILGGIIIVAVVLLPQGAVGFARDAWRARRVSFLDTIRSYRL